MQQVDLGAGRNDSAIQLVYHTSNRNIWEYARDFDDGRVDFSAFMAGKCPLCGQCGCLRQITPYKRGVIELFPWRMGMLSVARFLCRRSRKTVSLLPVELVPYHRYTLRSMLLAVCLLRVVRGRPSSRLEDVLDELPADSDATIYLLRCWLTVILRGLRRAHVVLRRWFGLADVRSEDGLAGALVEVGLYLDACGIRGPPDRGAVARLARRYSRTTRRFLVGRPSQERRA